MMILRQKYFSQWYQVKQHGTGLGLAISQMLINQHGGLIEFDTEDGKNRI
jgi:nitrogen-specific signal transduction histidine kinase